MKQEMTSMSMRWRVDKDQEAQFRADLARHDLKVQWLMEAMIVAYASLSEEMKEQLAERITDQGPSAAGQWLGETIAAGQWLTHRIAGGSEPHTTPGEQQ